MTSIHTLDLPRLRWGLFGLVAALFLDAVDLEVEDMDPLHDGAALAFYALLGWGLGQRQVKEHGAAPWVFWTPLAARAAAWVVPMISKDLERSTYVALGLQLAFTGALLGACLMMVRIAGGAGISSTTRWRASARNVGLLMLLPGLVTAFTMTRPAVQLPFKPYLGSLDSTWWREGLVWLVMAAALLGVASVVVSAWVTWRSAGRRT